MSRPGKMPSVSVVIPTYNRAEYLRQALASVFAQSFAPWEVIVVDDGSSDRTPEVVQAFGAKVRYVRQDHQGIAAARNRGLEVAQGEVIAWLDADDLWEPNYLSTVVPLLTDDATLDGVYSGLRYIDAAGNLLPQSSRKVVKPADLYSSLAEECFIQTSTFAVRRRCFARVGGFDLAFQICEDYDMFLRLAKECTIVGVPLPLVRYRVHGHSTMNDVDTLCRFRLEVPRKHFGPEEGDPLTWPDGKRRAYACAYRFVALAHIQSGRAEQGWQFLAKGASIWPEILGRLDTFYELACGDQPRGRRGQADLMDIKKNGAELLRRLDTLFAQVGTRLVSVRRAAYGNAYLALGMLSDQAGQWAMARRYLRQALAADPRLLGSYPVVRRLLKVHAGKRLVRAARGAIETLRGTRE